MRTILVLLLAITASSQDLPASKTAATPLDAACTAEDRANNFTGTVTLRLVVDETGKTHDVTVVKKLRKDLDKAAREAAKTWHFEPAMKDGKPVRVMINVETTFECGKQASEVSVTTPPRAIYTPDPQPPASKEARRAKINQLAVLWAALSEDGTVTDAKVQRSCGNAEWDQAAVDALKAWRFEPAKKNGKAVPTQVNVEVLLWRP